MWDSTAAYSYASLSLDLSRGIPPDEHGLGQGADSLALAGTALKHEYVHFLQFLGTSFGNIMTGARLDWISTHQPALRKLVVEQGGLPIPLISGSKGPWLNSLVHSLGGNLLWTGLAWDDGRLQKVFEQERQEFGATKGPFASFVLESGWDLPQSTLFPEHPFDLQHLASRELLESWALTACRHDLDTGDGPRQSGSFEPAPGIDDGTVPDTYLLMERLVAKLNLGRRAIMAMADLAFCPAVQLSRQPLDGASRAWEDFLPAWRFRRLLDEVAQNRIPPLEPNQGFAEWADCAAASVGWVPWSEVRSHLIADARDTLHERRMAAVWSNEVRSEPIGVELPRWLAQTERPELKPLFVSTGGKRHINATQEDLLEAGFIINVLTLFDHLATGSRKNQYQGFECAPNHFEIECPAQQGLCGVFPGPEPLGCPAAAFLRRWIGVGPEGIQLGDPQAM